MRILELEIQELRGIRHLKLTPDGNNFVVWGPNGSGKSAIVDAIDFLLTGRVSRLHGKGTGGISLKKHGPHILCKPDQSKVRAIIQLPGMTKPVEMERCMSQPDTLLFDKAVAPILQPILLLAQRSQHVLTRREILKYITAEAGTRAQEIQVLLNIKEIEEIRKAFVNANNVLISELQAAKTSLKQAESAVSAQAQILLYSEDKVVQYININRAILKGEAISTTASTVIRAGITASALSPNRPPVNPAVLEQQIANLRNALLPGVQEQVAATDNNLRALIATVKSDTQLLHALSHLKLTTLGIELLDETGNCPLCGATWAPHALRAYLDEQLAKGKTADRHQSAITQLSEKMLAYVNNTVESLKAIISDTTKAGLDELRGKLQAWLDDLLSLSSSLGSPLEKYPDERFGADQVKKMLAPSDFKDLIATLLSQVKQKFPAASTEQTAWDNLTLLFAHLQTLERATKQYKRATLSQKRSQLLLDAFLRSRHAVLDSLFEGIKDRFVSLYRTLHGEDEDKFNATIHPDGAFEVDFYGNGKHPPHALHSEGHQDSMGLCLYLALAEHLSGGFIDLVILDDVMMSVDADHRRQLSHILSDSFPHRQFVITTHDRTWAHQLRTEGVVSQRGTVEFYQWNLKTGPKVNSELDMWERIETDIQHNNIPSAAARLRRGSEHFFSTACQNLEARIAYKQSGSYDLGELLPAAFGRYQDLLKKAKQAAQSWSHKDLIEEYNELDSQAGQVFRRSQAEQWPINVGIHFNNWENFTASDFHPVVEAFEDLHHLFRCSACGTLLRLAKEGATSVAVRCNCGKVNWNLSKKTAGN